MKILIIILMFIMTVYGVSTIADAARKVKIGSTTANRFMTGAGCIAIALITIAYNAASLYLLVKVV